MTQQSNRMQILNPLTVRDIALATRYILHVLRIHKKYLEASRLEDLIERNPVHSGGFHRYRSNTAELQPVGQFVQVSCEGAERSHRLLGTLRRNGDEDLFSTDVDPSRVRMHHR
jgi:hypothetical protein